MKMLIDAGANRLLGFEKLKMLESITTDTIKIFIEPNPECWSHIEQNLASIGRASLIKAALGDKEDMAMLVTSGTYEADTGATVMGEEFYDASLMRWGLKNELKKYHPTCITTIASIIKTHSIDPRECVLKLDIEGAEYVVIQDIINNKMTFQKIYCEFHLFDAKHEKLKYDFAKQLNELGTILCEWD
jgi:FkbM family methyltransferase